MLVGAVLLFGKRLPEVAMRGAAQFVKLRRSVARMWRETGLDSELRRVQRELDQAKRDEWAATHEHEWQAQLQATEDEERSHKESWPREDHPEDFDSREVDEFGEEERIDIHAMPDPEPRSDVPGDPARAPADEASQGPPEDASSEVAEEDPVPPSDKREQA